MRFRPRVPDDSPNLPSLHPGREALLLSIGVAALGGLLLLVLAFLVEIVVWALPADADVHLDVGVPLPKAAGPDAERARDRLQRLTNELARGWPDNPYQVRLTLIADPTPNAFALPGGHVLVTRGLLEQISDDDELAFVLGHELGHLKNRDHLRSLGRATLAGLVASLVSGGSAETLLGAGHLLSLRFSRQAETRADRVALDLMHEGRRDPAAAERFFSNLASAPALAGTLPTFLSTHPGSAERARDIAAYAASRGYDSHRPDPPPP